MGGASVTFRLPRDMSAADLESALVGGPDGIRAHVRAVGGDYGFHDTAIRRQDVPQDPPDHEGPHFGVEHPDGTFSIGWTGSAGSLAFYGTHLALARAQLLGYVDDGPAVRASGRYGEARGRLAQRDEEGLTLYALFGNEPSRIAIDDMSASERATWEILATRCACPVCIDRAWTAEEADAFAAELEKDPTRYRELDRYAWRTPALIRAAILAGVLPRGAGVRRGVVCWAPTMPVAIPLALALTRHRRIEVRRSAYGVLVSDRTLDEAVLAAAIEASLSDRARIVLDTVRECGQLRHLSAALRAALDARFLVLLETTVDEEIACGTIIALWHRQKALDVSQQARFEALLERRRDQPAIATLIAQMLEIAPLGGPRG